MCLCLVAATTSPSAAQEARRVSAEWTEAPLRDVLRTFAVFSGRTIVSGPEIDGIFVTASINDQRWDVVLQTILTAHALRGVEDEYGIIRVQGLLQSNQRTEVEPLVTRVYELRFVSVEEMQTVVSGLISPRGSVAAIASRNVLVVTDVRETHRTVSALLGG